MQHFADGETWIDETEEDKQPLSVKAIVNMERDRMRSMFTEYFRGMDINVHVEHFSDEAPYPTRYTINYKSIHATAPAFELALRDFIERLIESLPLLDAPKKRTK